MGAHLPSVVSIFDKLLHQIQSGVLKPLSSTLPHFQGLTLASRVCVLDDQIRVVIKCAKERKKFGASVCLHVDVFEVWLVCSLTRAFKTLER